jgi:hypothetical protein
MSDSVIAVMPNSSDFDPIQKTLSTEGIHVQLIRSFEEALRLLAVGRTPVYVCDPRNDRAGQDSILRMLRTREVSRVVLLSRLADERI